MKKNRVDRSPVDGAQSTPLKELFVTDQHLRAELEEEQSVLPRLTLSPRQLCDIEMLLVGGFSPLEGFLGEEDYDSVVENMRLKNGTLWPMPITLDVPLDAPYTTGDRVLLCDQYGKPLAILGISSVFTPDKRKEARSVFGTEDPLHPGVRHLFESNPRYLGGKLFGLSRVESYDFGGLRHTPRELREWFAKHDWNAVIGFQTRNPLHRAHFELIRRASEEHNAPVLIHPVVGLTKEGDIDYRTRVRCYKFLHERYAGDFTKLSLLPLAMRMGGPREALWHALIRKNYGCTHFIVGRDHAGPGKDASGVPFYGPYEAQELALSHQNELGIVIIPFQEMVYVENEERYIPTDQVKEHHSTRSISGTEVRRMLREREEIPAWFSFPEIVAELRAGVKREERVRGLVIFFTGLSGAGKSTIARILQGMLHERTDRRVTFLDGDVVRKNLSKGLGFTREDRNENISRIGFVASEIARHGGIALCAAIAPYEEARRKNRDLVGFSGTYVEVYLSTPLSVCRKRDAKGLYRKAQRGELKNLTGLNDPYEPPIAPEIVIDTSNSTPHECAEKIFEYLVAHARLNNFE